jgi:hypothetical protein
MQWEMRIRIQDDCCAVVINLIFNLNLKFVISGSSGTATIPYVLIAARHLKNYAIFNLIFLNTEVVFCTLTFFIPFFTWYSMILQQRKTRRLTRSFKLLCAPFSVPKHAFFFDESSFYTKTTVHNLGRVNVRIQVSRSKSNANFLQ